MFEDIRAIYRNVPDNCTVVGAPGKIVRLDGKPVSLELEKI